MKLSLQVRYSLAVVCILAAVVGFMGIAHLHGFRALITASTNATSRTVSEALYREALKQGRERALFLAGVLSEPLAGAQQDAIRGLLKGAGEETGTVYVALHDAGGRLVAEASPGARAESAPAVTARALAKSRSRAFAPPQIAQVLTGQSVATAVDDTVLHIAAPVVRAGRSIGYIRLGISRLGTKTDVAAFSGYMDAVAQTSNRFFISLYVTVALMIVLIGLGIGIIMVRDMARPIEALARYMRRIGTGKYDEPPPFDRNDELGDLARELGHMAQNLKKVAQVSRLATLGELAVGVAHELNQPLNTIRLAADNVLLSGEGRVEDDRFTENKLRLISEQAANMGDLIQRMCVVGRSAGPRTRIDARESVRDAYSMLVSQCEDEGIEMRLELPEGEAPVLGRRNELSQVIINLLTNARDAVVDAARGHDGASGGRAGRISVRVTTGPDDIVIQVADSGGGIAPEIMDRIFDPFFTTKDVTKGTGLGLSISFGIVDSMGGRLTVDNTGGGATFSVSLPRAGAVTVGAAS
ncbi:MAG: ATP-binding protein [Alphaproteobacteria bacterium]|nr:ATP-binding protein [Alphaproteobacteria bacterium]